MRRGHKTAQTMFLETGKLLELRVRRTYTQSCPTDGVWLGPSIQNPSVSDEFADELPLVAIEVIVSEGKKARLGSLASLETASPSLGVLLLQDDEIRRGLQRNGSSPEQAEEAIKTQTKQLADLAASTRQRIVVWRYADLERMHRRALRNHRCTENSNRAALDRRHRQFPFDKQVDGKQTDHIRDPLTTKEVIYEYN